MPSTPVELVLSKLPTAKATAGGWIARCPAHKDGSPSLKVDQGSDGRALLRCHAGCTVPAICERMGISVRDLMPPDDGTRSFNADRGLYPQHLQVMRGGRPTQAAALSKPVESVESYSDSIPPDPSTWPIVASYEYVDAKGALVFVVERKQEPHGRGKSFWQRKPDGSYGLKGVTSKPIYRLPAVEAAIARGEPILLVEGEKDVHTAEQLGWVATTNAGGSNGWKPEYAEQLANADVIIVPDNDEPGRDWAWRAAGTLVEHAKRVRIIALPRVPEKGDLTDWVTDCGGDDEALAGFVLQAKTWTLGDPIPEPPAPSKYTVLRADELEHLPPPRWLVKDILTADSLASLIGQPASGKSFAAIDLGCCVATGRPWLGHETRSEDGVQRPVLYLASEGRAGLWKRINAWRRQRAHTGSLPVYFLTDSVNLLQTDDTQHVIRAMRNLPMMPALVIVDTLSRSMPGGDENAVKDMGMAIANATAIQHAAGCTVLLVHHTQKNGDAERGSGSLRGACDTMLMLRDDDGTRTLMCEKQKDSEDFEPHYLRFTPAYGSVVVDLETSTDLEISGVDTMYLRGKDLKALTDLYMVGGNGGLTSTDWKEVTAFVHSAFHRIRGRLVHSGLVRLGTGKQGQRYTVTQQGIEALRFARSNAGQARQRTPSDSSHAAARPAGVLQTGLDLVLEEGQDARYVRQVAPLLAAESLPVDSELLPKAVPNCSQTAPKAVPEEVPNKSQTSPKQVPNRSQGPVSPRAESLTTTTTAPGERNPSRVSVLREECTDVLIPPRAEALPELLPNQSQNRSQKQSQNKSHSDTRRPASRREPVSPDVPPPHVLEQRPYSEDEVP